MPAKKNSSLLRFLLLLLPFSFVLLNSCEQKGNKDTPVTEAPSGDTTVADESPQQAYAYDENAEHNPNIIRYYGATLDEVRKTLETFPPIAPVYELFGQFVQLQDSIETEKKLWGQPLTDPQDTLKVFPFKQRAYQAILDYKKQMATGAALKDRCPSLLELSRVTEPNDSSLSLLPQAGQSDLLAKGNFFFLGGTPFISKVYAEDGTSTLTDPQGRPETRFVATLQENVKYLLTSVYHAKPGVIDIGYGQPLYTYEMGDMEVYGIGSLIHRFVQRVPVFFITENGMLPANLVMADVNLANEQSCGSGDTYIEFACSASIEAKDILGIYIPYGAAPTSCAFNRLSDQVWTADLNSDGTADFACVSEIYSGAESDMITELLWFANINGTWKIIDWAEHPECT